MLRWQKSLVDWYGHKNLVKFNAGAGDEWSASNAFESGKVAMHLDGEWRVSFIANEAKKLSYATAPMPTDKPDLYGSGYITGTIIGIPKGSEEPPALLAAHALPDDELVGARHVLERDPQRADDEGIAEVEDPQARQELRHLPEHLRAPEVGDPPDHRRGRRVPGARHELGDEVAVREGRRPDGLAEDARQADRRTAQAGGGPAEGDRLTAAPVALPAIDRRRARRRAAWRRRLTVLGFMSPWLVGFTVFVAYPLVMSAYLSFHKYDLLSSPKWVGLANYKYAFTVDPQVWPAVKNTLWFVAVSVPLSVHVRVRDRADADAGAAAAAAFFRTVFYLPALAPPVAATLGFVYLLNPVTGPINSGLEKIGIEGPLWFQSPEWSKPSLVAARALGDRQHDGDLPRGDPRRPAASVRVGRARRRRPVAAASVGHAPVGQPRDPVLGRARRDLRPAVLHAGVRRGEHRVGPGVAGG